ncbi:MAG: prepilin-type N-terminal cleavage/methylation domain-containing protein [Candidatus Saccharimonadaceae bacterium]
MIQTKFYNSLGKEGFTLVEVLVTVVVATIFIITFSQLHIVQSRLGSIMNAYDSADLLAYNNLRTFAYGQPPIWFDCTYASGSPVPMTLFSSSSPVSGIPSPVTQTVIATAPYGCGGSSSGIGYPIRVTSTITYDVDAKVVVHATYSTY